MDLTLGGPVDTGETSSLHEGNCNDSTFGCIKCWNASNDGKGTLFDCEWCKKEDFTVVVEDPENPELYQLCSECMKRYREVCDSLLEVFLEGDEDDEEYENWKMRREP